jgi:hypothetical protein
MRRRVVSGDVFVGKNPSGRGNSLLHTGIIQDSRTRGLNETLSVFSYERIGVQKIRMRNKFKSTYLPAPETTHTQIHDGCHITHHNEIFIILISDFRQEIYVLPDDDMQCAIEICRSSESVLMCTILD